VGKTSTRKSYLKKNLSSKGSKISKKEKGLLGLSKSNLQLSDNEEEKNNREESMKKKNFLSKRKLAISSVFKRKGNVSVRDKDLRGCKSKNGEEKELKGTDLVPKLNLKRGESNEKVRKKDEKLLKLCEKVQKSSRNLYRSDSVKKSNNVKNSNLLARKTSENYKKNHSYTSYVNQKKLRKWKGLFSNKKLSSCRKYSYFGTLELN